MSVWRCRECHPSEPFPEADTPDDAQRAALRHISSTGHRQVLAETEDGTFISMKPQHDKNVELIEKAKDVGFSTAMARGLDPPEWTM